MAHLFPRLICPYGRVCRLIRARYARPCRSSAAQLYAPRACSLYGAHAPPHARAPPPCPHTVWMAICGATGDCIWVAHLLCRERRIRLGEPLLDPPLCSRPPSQCPPLRSRSASQCPPLCHHPPLHPAVFWCFSPSPVRGPLQCPASITAAPTSITAAPASIIIGSAASISDATHAPCPAPELPAPAFHPLSYLISVARGECR